LPINLVPPGCRSSFERRLASEKSSFQYPSRIYSVRLIFLGDVDFRAPSRVVGKLVSPGVNPTTRYRSDMLSASLLKS
jgi:hypothetical protein